ncbi:DUF4129 domain-containing protein [Nocardioides sp. YIM 152315]|uniref:DUF4129 domain-containing protein n=1 Tax=Nocardioides sp. YIM 152315 TaxID=3031760 RepID=UPI0023DAB977|nr:DUF4129 domain-containing protein [Nocardioides sp. YIM 152315]MDF1602997.1 DUF4129 domain-containing protein [Nocardioides sp. YIM 152315]
MTARRAGTVAVTLVSVGVVLAVLLVTWAASIGPHDVLRGEGWQPETTVSPTPADGAATAQAQPDPDDAETVPHNEGLLHVLALVLNVAAAVLAAWLLVRLTRWTRRARRERRRRIARQRALGGAEFDVMEPGAAVARDLLADADAQRDLLSGGTPRNAVVACWHRFEVTAAAAGIERKPWETSSEYTLRILDLVAADTAAVGRLAGLYREARFSEHDLSEDDRSAALAALDEVHRTIRAPVPASRVPA